MELTEDNYHEIKDLLYEKTGISLKDNKQALVESRLTKSLRVLNLSTFKEYITLVRKDSDELTNFINSLTTNKTEFFRENDHFDYLTNTVLKNNLQSKTQDSFNVWSAASSTGEEVYTLAMVLHEGLGEKISSCRILGTDLDTNVLAKAESGVYKSALLAPMSPMLKETYFNKGTGSNSGFYKVSDSLKNLIKFRQFNLIEDEFKLNIKFDVIFLRNVLIYFEDDTIESVVNKLSQQLKIGGYFFIGHSESLNRVKHNLKYVAPSVFQKVR